MGLLGMLCYLLGAHAVRVRRGLGGVNEDWRDTDNEERTIGVGFVRAKLASPARTPKTNGENLRESCMAGRRVLEVAGLSALALYPPAVVCGSELKVCL